MNDSAVYLTVIKGRSSVLLQPQELLDVVRKDIFYLDMPWNGLFLAGSRVHVNVMS
jgi:hypothetical protein